MRREWIEMIASGASLIGMASPSMRREWIEMGSRSRLRTPSMRSEWVETRCTKVKIEQGHKVSLHAEGVD